MSTSDRRIERPYHRVVPLPRDEAIAGDNGSIVEHQLQAAVNEMLIEQGMTTAPHGYEIVLEVLPMTPEDASANIVRVRVDLVPPTRLVATGRPQVPTVPPVPEQRRYPPPGDLTAPVVPSGWIAPTVLEHYPAEHRIDPVPDHPGATVETDLPERSHLRVVGPIPATPDKVPPMDPPTDPQGAL